eukprot:6626926-Ditylum_brightwellii.AAC.1
MLPHWEQVLLSYFNKSEHSHVSLGTHLELGTSLWFVTDGRVKGPFGYFGWVIATDRQILLEGYGHSQSNPDLVESLCTESSGLLAVGRFLLRWIQFYGIKPCNASNLHYCDNSTLSKKMVNFFNNYKCKPTEYTLSDMDIQMQIEETFRQINMEF